MDDKLDIFLATNAKYFPADKLDLIRQKIEAKEEFKYTATLSLDFKDPTVNTLISIFFGAFGVDRFMLKENGMGFLKLFTGGVCGVLYLIDCFTTARRTREANFNKLMSIL